MQSTQLVIGEDILKSISRLLITISGYIFLYLFSPFLLLFLQKGLLMRLLIALLLALNTQLLSKYILKDELGINMEFHHQVETMGSEIFQKSGVGVYMLVLQTTNGKSLSTIGAEYLDTLPKNSVILTFAETEKKVDILSSPDVEKLFDKEQILSPYPWSGTILPILGEKTKGDPRNKYSVALFNGYADMVEQIANELNIRLDSAVGSANKIVINSLRLVFYGILAVALTYFLYKKFFKRREDER
jgi:hypothetical protein